MIVMAKRKPGRPRTERKTQPVSMRMAEDIIAALEALAERNRRTRKQEIMIAIEDRLRAEGLWPRKD